MTAVTELKSRKVVRSLSALIPLIKEDLRKAQEAANRAAEPYKIAAAEKFAEARSQMTYSEYVSWVYRHFNIRETQAKEYLSVGRYMENYGAARPVNLESHLRDKGYNRDRVSKQDWHNPVKETIERTKREQERIEEEELSRAEEREEQRKLAMRLIDIGFKVLSKELHPDKGGSRGAMARLNIVRDRLKAHA